MQPESQGTFFPLIPKHQKKQQIFWDVDDVILNSSEAIVNIINKQYLEPQNLPTKTYADCTSWDYKSVYEGMDREKTEGMFECNLFWSTVTIRPEFLEMLNSGFLTSNYENIFITKGTERNLYKKREYLESKLGNYWSEFEYIGLTMEQKKQKIDMSEAIQIDDVFANLSGSNAHIKILMQNGISTPWNNNVQHPKTLPNDNLYNVDYLDQVKEILEFNLKCKL